MYTIIIKETTVETVVLPKDWRRINDSADGYGYTPETETRATVERQVYTQTVKELNIEQVICAVNGMPRVTDEQLSKIIGGEGRA